MATQPPVICLPVKLDAYMLNTSACAPFPSATLAPLAQPNFTFLRLDSALMEPDVLPYHDLHNASPAAVNPRVTDLATGAPRLERQGVYLHWMLPRLYRSGVAEPTGEQREGLKAPSFRAAPDRWLVLRRLHPGSFQPADVVSKKLMKWVEAWVVESNKIRNITEFGYEVDIQLECAPFISGDANAQLDAQAEIFIGAKTRLDQWSESRQAQGAGFVPLNVGGAANPLFADYTPHNSNVFSILDNFAYKPDPKKDELGYLTKAVASYYVLGWHSLPGEDSLNNLGGTSLSETLRQCFLEMKKDDKSINLDKLGAVRSLCHGAMYSVAYAKEGTTGIDVPAHRAAQKFADAKSHPVTVGTNALDAILAYVRAHQGAGTPTEDSILHLETLLLKQDDDIESQQEALDMLTAHNFQPAQDNGSHWSFSAAQGKNAIADVAKATSRTQETFQPTAEQQQQLANLNAAQSALDSASRELKRARWGLFARWWKFCADGSLVTNIPIKDLKDDTKAQADLVRRLEKKTASLVALVEDAKKQKQLIDPKSKNSIVEQGSQPRFHKQTDPTILVPGIKNPWPLDWLDPLRVRLNRNAGFKSIPQSIPDVWQDLKDIGEKAIPAKLPKDIAGTASQLIAEFFNLRPKDDGENWKEQPSGILPLYHDHEEDLDEPVDGVGPDGKGRDRWCKTQPYFPLFLEFEVRYYHLDWNLWEFGKPNIDPLPGNPHPTRYGLGRKSDVKGQTGDERVITGRILVLPQPGFTLSVNIERLFLATKSDDLPSDLKTEDQQKKFLALVKKLDYLSAPMTGFMDHLITLLNGTHVKPSVRIPGQPARPLQAAVNAGNPAGFGPDEIRLMDIATTKTPYADYVPFPDDTIDPLKPVTHGQFKFTRLDILDKWGQAISAINPAPAVAIPPLYPALSEYFHPQHLESDPGQTNTVGHDPYDHCQFGQFPPTINQEARINAAFLRYEKVEGKSSWRPCTEWENPVWGFLVVNYAEYALQVFLPDGTFYREVRLGGPSGATETPAWKPFEPPPSKDPSQTTQFPQLDALLQKLRNVDYLRQFVNTINSSLGSIPHTPNQYAEFLNAVVGRPLALANAGFSLELAEPPLEGQSTVNKYKAPKTPKLLSDYRFPVKLGDKDRTFDGLVGYFKSKDEPTSGSLALGDELVLDSMLTYFPSGGSATTAITKDKYQRVQPYHLSAETLDLGGAAETARNGAAAARRAAEHHAQLRRNMAGVLMDPFAKLHLYSGILPVGSLQLPGWGLQAAMQRMTAFFHMGPLIVTQAGALRYDPDKKLTPDYNLAAMGEVAEPADPDDAGDGGADPSKPAPKPVGVAIPAIKSAEWNWLGPFAVRDAAPAGAGGGSAGQPAAGAKKTRWNPFVISHLDNKPKYEKGPYMAIEGFLQLKHPITAPETL